VGVGHPDVAVIDWTVERAETEDEWAILDILEHVAFADPDAAITLLERLLRSPDVNEDIEYLGVLESPLEQDFPDFPEYWEHTPNSTTRSRSPTTARPTTGTPG